MVDSQNPVIVKMGGERKVMPYVVPIIGIDSGKIMIEEKWRAGRNYFIAN